MTTAFLFACGVGCFAAFNAFALGVILGVWTYATISGHFQSSLEQKYQARLASILGRMRLREGALERAKERLMDRYGRDLPDGHREVLDEELEKALGGVWVNKK